MNETHTLQSLLRKAADDRQLSGRALGELAQAHGWSLKHTTVNSIIRGSYKSTPSDDTIRAIAFLANVPERVAFEAAGRRVPGKPFAEELPPGVDDLSPKERKAVIEMLRVLVAQRQELDDAATDHQQEQEPRPQEGSPKHGRPAGGDRARRSPSMKRGNVTRLNWSGQSAGPASGEMPPWDESKELAAFQPDPDDVE